MSTTSWISDLETMAKTGDGALIEVLGRRCTSFDDASLLERLYQSRNKQQGLPQDDSLDRRIAFESVASSLWIQSGGVRFCPSDSVAASFVLTKQATGEIALPFPAQLIQLPRGFMPSPVLGDFSGGMLVARMRPGLIMVSSFVDRPGSGGTSIVMFSDNVDENDVTSMNLSRDLSSEVSPGPQPTSDDAFRSAAKMTIRIVRNLASWLTAFPVARSSDSRATVKPGSIGASLEIGQMVFLKTEVTMDASMRQVASGLVRMDADYGTRKMAMRHIVRGHWKRQVIKDGRKLIFVAPYWRGPDGPQAWGRVYKLNDSKSSH